MPRVLTVDDSRAIRQIITNQLTELGCETEEAEDGEKGLARLQEVSVDLILLDVTMPVMDGPEMLRRLRESGNQTPVIMLTSESKRSVVASALKLGIEEYVLKPFKAEELRAKVHKVLRLPATATVPATAPAAAPNGAATPLEPAADKPVASGGKQPVDVLVIDDMENVHKKLRTLLPQNLTLNGCVNAPAALALCREHVYRVVLVDTVIPDVNSVALMNQLRALQSNATFVALMLRTTSDAAAEVGALGYDGFLFKPFAADGLDDFLTRHLGGQEQQELVTTEANVMRAAPFSGREERLDKYFTRVNELMRSEMEKMAAACYDDVVADLGQVPIRPDKLPRLVIDIASQATRIGVALRLVGQDELSKLLSKFTETASLPFFGSVTAACAA